MEPTLLSIIIGLGIAAEAILAVCLALRLAQANTSRRDREILAAIQCLQERAQADALEVRGQVTALQDEIISLRGEVRRVGGPGHQELLDATAGLERRVRRDLQESLPIATPDLGRVLTRLDRLDSRMEKSEARLALEIQGLRGGLASIREGVEDPASRLRHHQVDAMVKLAELLSEITVGVAQGRAPCPLPERIRDGAIAHLHRYGMFLPDEIHRSVETLLAVLLTDGESFFSGRSAEGPVPASDQDYFNNGATIPGDLFQDAGPETRRGLRICATALGVLRRIQAHLLSPATAAPVPAGPAVHSR